MYAICPQTRNFILKTVISRTRRYDSPAKAIPFQFINFDEAATPRRRFVSELRRLRNANTHGDNVSSAE